MKNYLTINIAMYVNTQIIKVDPEIVEPDKIEIIADVLSNDGIIVYPTETFYGLGANCFSEEAVKKIYRLKRRAASKPVSVVISDLDMLRSVAVNIPPEFKSLYSELWPGPLTLIFKASALLPKNLLGSAGSIGVRLPGHPWLRSLVRCATFPIAATSANVSGEGETTQPEKVIEMFNGKVDLIVDGGKTKGIMPSTVVDLTTEKPQILREGAISASELRKYLFR